MKKLILCCLTALVATAAFVLLVISDSIFNFIPMLIVGAVAIVMWYVSFVFLMKYKGEKNTAKFEKAGAKGKALIEKITAEPKANVVLDSPSFAKEGLKMIVITAINGGEGGVEWPVIITKDCIYEDWMSSFSIPTDTKVAFSCGSSSNVTRHKKMDVNKSEAFGYMAGGIGAAAYNATKAAEINAAGGIEYSVGTGKCPIMVSSGHSNAQLRYTIIANDIFDSLPDNLNGKFWGDIVKKTDWFTLFKFDLFEHSFALGVAKNYNDLLAYIIQKHTN